MKNYRGCAVLTLGSLIVCPAFSAGTMQDAINSCLANANSIITQQETLWRKKETWTAYAKMLCDKTITTKEQAQAQGIDLGIAPLAEGVPIPLNFKFSNNSSERATFDRVYCSNTDVKNATSDLSLVIRGARSEDVADAISKCALRVFTSNDDFWCEVAKNKGKSKSASFTGDIHFRPLITMPTPKMVTGAIIDASGAKVPIVQGRKPMAGNVVNIGSNTFTAVMDVNSVGQTLQVQLNNNMSCTVPVVEDLVKAKVWIEGWGLKEAADAVFNFRHEKDCSDNREPAQSIFCVDPAEVPDTSKSITSVQIQGNCGSYLEGVQRDPSELRCVIARSSLKGCGYKNYTLFKNCEGRGWVDGSTSVPRKTKSGAKVSGPEESWPEEVLSGRVWARNFAFSKAWPPEATLDPKINFEIVIDYIPVNSLTRSKVTLTPTNRIHRDVSGGRCFKASGGTSSSEDAAVLVVADDCRQVTEKNLSASDREVLEKYTDTCYGKRKIPRGSSVPLTGKDCDAP